VNGRRGTGLREPCSGGRIRGGSLSEEGSCEERVTHPGPARQRVSGNHRPPHEPHHNWKESNPCAFRTGIEGLPWSLSVCLNGTDSASALDGFQCVQSGSAGMPSSPPPGRCRSGALPHLDDLLVLRRVGRSASSLPEDPQRSSSPRIILNVRDYRSSKYQSYWCLPGSGGGHEVRDEGWKPGRLDWPWRWFQG